MKTIVPSILLAVFIFALLNNVFCGVAFSYDEKALILIDEESSSSLNSESQYTLANLLGHFDLPYDVKKVDLYSQGDVDNYRVTFYLGSYWDRALPADFLNDVLTTNSRVVWINYNLWKLGWDHQQAFEDRFGMRYMQTSPTGRFKQVTFDDRSFTRSQDVFAQVSILNGNLAHGTSFITNGTRSYPYIIQSGNFYFVADDPMSQAAEDSPYLVFCEALHDMVGIQHATSHKALVRIEDIDPTEDPASIRAIADYLNTENVPFGLAVIPRFNDPLGAWGEPVTIDLSDRPDLVNALNYAVSKGGTIIMHGYTHQYDSVANPENGVTGVDSEFYIEQKDVNGDIVDVSPVPEDCTEWVQGRIDSGVDILYQAGYARPLIWETPHYLASELDNQVFSNNFGMLYQRFANAYFPYVIYRSVYGSSIIPENLGYIEPGIITPQILINRADKNLAIRDGFASFFYHSEVDISYLKTTISGIKAKGFTFVDVGSLAATDENPPAVYSVGPAGAIFTASATVSAGYSDHGSGIDTTSVRLTLDGKALGSCTVSATNASCPVSDLGVGLHVIGGTVSDNAGNSTPVSGSFTVTDNQAPVVVIIEPAGVLNPATTAFTATYSDPEPTSGIDQDSPKLSLDDDGAPLPCTAAGGVISCPVAGLIDGEHSAVVSITDNAGNLASAAGNFIVDTVAPSVTNTGPSGWQNVNALTITAEVIESNLPDLPAEVFIDGGQPWACMESDTHLSCPVSGLSEGAHSYAVHVFDKAGNTGSAAGGFSVDTTVPRITNLEPTGTIYVRPAAITADYSDDGSGIDKTSVSIILDGAELSGCLVGETGVSCTVPASGVTKGTHDLVIAVSDAAGNTGTVGVFFNLGSCGDTAPSLSLSTTKTYWRSFADYVARLLTVDYYLSNDSEYPVDVSIMGSLSNNGVRLETPTPSALNISGYTGVSLTLLYNVPPGVTSFRTTVYVNARDPCGGNFNYPGLFPGT